MSYAWVGLPKAFNGTLPDGGDPSMRLPLIDLIIS
jgi:hypothetical protein